MEKHVIVLPDGTELSSGVNEVNAIRSVMLTESVNDGTELSPGSVCASYMDAVLISPGGGLSVGTGMDVALYRENEIGSREKLGVYTTERPTRASANTYRLLAYDHVAKLDRDVTGWLDGLAWPVKLYDLVNGVCAYCGVVLKSSSIPRGDFRVKRFSRDGTTGRKILRWAGQLCVRFIRADTDGKIEFGWYENSGAHIGPGGGEWDIPYLGKGLSYEDYQVAPIEKVQIKQGGEQDVGVVWPADLPDGNAYVISGNALVLDNSLAELQPVAKAIYEELKNLTYTPASIKLYRTGTVKAGDILTATDINGETIQTLVMTLRTEGQKMTIESTGSPRRDSSSAINSMRRQDIEGRVFNLSVSVDGLRTENKNMNGAISRIDQTVEGISGQVADAEGDIAQLVIKSTGIEQRVADTEENVSKIQQEAGMVQVLVKGTEGTLTTTIDQNTWSAIYKTLSGETGSGFRFDFASGQFVYDGTGVFRSADGKTYLEIVGNDLVLYKTAPMTGQMVDALRVGYQRDGTLDYPYILMGNATDTYVGMIKKFWDGFWIGNSAPKEDFGTFVPKAGYSGIFVSTTEGKTYVVDGANMQNVYTGDAIARFK